MYDFQLNSHDDGQCQANARVQGLNRSPFAALDVDASPVFDRDSVAGMGWTRVTSAGKTLDQLNQLNHKKEGDSNTENEVACA